MKKTVYLLPIFILTLSSCGTQEPFKATLNEVGSINVHTETVSNFYLAEKYDYSDLPAEVNARVNQGDNLPINITWESNSNSETQKYSLVFTEKDQTLTYEVVGVKEFNFYNYKLDTEYTLHLESNDFVSEDVKFTTPSGYVRTINVEGVSNFRDLGKKNYIKQGLIYRSLTWENNTIQGSEYTEITEEGLKEIKNLGIKTEIDLRKSSEIGELAGSYEGIDYKHMPLHYGGKNILTYSGSENDNPAVIKNIFDVLALESSYPLDFHCIRGTDRTGCIAFLVEGLLGIEEEFLKKDFIFSNFYNIGSPVRLNSIEHEINPSSTNNYVNVLKQEEGDSLQEKIFNYLKNKIGVSEESLNNIINILKDR